MWRRVTAFRTATWPRLVLAAALCSVPKLSLGGFLSLGSTPSAGHDLDGGTILLTASDLQTLGLDSGSHSLTAFASSAVYSERVDTTTIIAAAVPEPTSLALLGMGGFALLGYRWWRRDSSQDIGTG